MELHIFLFHLIMAVLISVNSQGLRSPDRRKSAFSYFLRHRLDIILLQETHWTVIANGTEVSSLITERITLEVLLSSLIYDWIIL